MPKGSFATGMKPGVEGLAIARALRQRGGEFEADKGDDLGDDGNEVNVVRMAPLLLTPAQVATVLQLSRSKVYELMASGDVPSIRIGRSRRVPTDLLRAYVNALPIAGDDRGVGNSEEVVGPGSGKSSS